MGKSSKLAVILALLMAASVWFYVQRVLIPHQKSEAAARGIPRGLLSDLYPRWLGSRELLIHHLDPYGPEVTREIQAGYYGRPLDPNRPSDPKDEERFAYPVYVVFVLAPTVWMPFRLVQTIFSWMLGLLTVASVPLWLRALRWRPSPAILTIVLVLTAGSFATIQGIKLQQLSLLVAALLAGAATLLAGGQFFWAGVLLALATIKPQLVVLPMAWLLLWALSSWGQRQKFFWGFVVTGLVLALGGIYFLPDWPKQFVAGLAAYNRYTGGRSLLDELTTPKIGELLTALLLVYAAMLGWRLRRASPGSTEFNGALAFLLAVTVIVAPMIAPYNHLLLLPAVLLVARSWQGLWRRRQGVGPARRLLYGSAALIFFWPWLASLGLALASAILPATSVQRAWAVPLWSSLGIPLAVLGLLVVCISSPVEPKPAA